MYPALPTSRQIPKASLLFCAISTWQAGKMCNNPVSALVPPTLTTAISMYPTLQNHLALIADQRTYPANIQHVSIAQQGHRNINLFILTLVASRGDLEWEEKSEGGLGRNDTRQ